MAINTESFSSFLRTKSIDTSNKRLLLTNFCNTEQEKDLSEPANCNGFGRIRHFARKVSNGWPVNPLPIDPACKALNLSSSGFLRGQVFQNAVCNWRCWYCFVPFNLLSANPAYSSWLSPKNLITLYLEQPDPPMVIDLTGGQPDLVPEWILWMMEEVRNHGLEDKVYLWSDDNLSNDYFWQYLTDAEREVISSYKNYGRVCCFKGFNAESFSFNTLADPALFDKQFQLFSRLLTTGIDLYAYATITTPTVNKIDDHICSFMDKLQKLDENLPLRTIPLEIQLFTPVVNRLDNIKRQALKNQWIAVEIWQRELENRFSSKQRELNIVDVPIRRSYVSSAIPSRS